MNTLLSNSYQVTIAIRGTTKDDFDVNSYNLVWCNKNDFAYDETISLYEIIEYVESKLHRFILLNPIGIIAPYNNVCGNNLNLDKANLIGYTFSPLKPFIFNLIDTYIHKNLKV